MTEPIPTDQDNTVRRPVSGRRSALLWLLIALLTAEFAAMVVASIVLVVEVFTAAATSRASGIAFLVLALVATVWLAYIVLGALRGRAWIRGAAIVWQVLMFAIGIGCFQGFVTEPAIGWALIVPAVAVVALLLTPSVVAATSSRQ